MRINLLFVATFFLLKLSFLSASRKLSNESVQNGYPDLSFEAWVTGHEKHYSSRTEYLYRKAVWHHNAEHIVDVHNIAYDKGYTTYKMTIENSPFADWTDQEFAESYLMEPRHCALNGTSSLDSRFGSMPTTKGKMKVDWREHGALTPVKNQGMCGSCWTFATTGTLEAHACLSQQKDCSAWTGLSEQQLVDCSGGFANEGCNGGWPSAALEYIKYNGGIASEASYPYHGENEDCSFQSEDSSGVEVIEVFNITYQDEGDLEKVVASIGPVSLAFQVAPDFRFYSHGVYDSFNATSNSTVCHNGEEWINHAVVAVGLDETEAGVPFYIIRNSWGSSWGMEGHFWMKRGINLCGVSDCASFPILPYSRRAPLQFPALKQNPKLRR